MCESLCFSLWETDRYRWIAYVFVAVAVSVCLCVSVCMCGVWCVVGNTHTVATSLDTINLTFISYNPSCLTQGHEEPGLLTRVAAWTEQTFEHELLGTETALRASPSA